MREAITLGFGGDFRLAGTPSSSYLADVFDFTRRVTSDTDWAMANLEFCFMPDGESAPASKGIAASKGANLSATGFAAFCLANNHVMDCGVSGLDATRRVLAAQGISTTGAGIDVNEACAPLAVECKGWRLAVISVTDATHHAATRTRPGVATLDHKRLLGQARSLRASHDLVIVNVHADFEFSNRPAPWKVRLSRRLAEAGADVIVHHHPHTLQGFEYHNGAFIAYSLGNLVFPVAGSRYMANRPGNVREGAFLKLKIESKDHRKPLIRHYFVPVLIDESHLSTIAQGDCGSRIQADLDRYRRFVEDPGELRRQHFNRCRLETAAYLKGMYYALMKRGIGGWWRHTLHPLRTQMARQGIRGALTAGLW